MTLTGFILNTTKSETTLEKLDKFIAAGTRQTGWMSVGTRRMIANGLIQLGVRPYSNPLYEYCIVVHPSGSLTHTEVKQLHDTAIKIRFTRIDEGFVVDIGNEYNNTTTDAIWRHTESL